MKYKPSVKLNNSLRDDFVNKLETIIFKIENNKTNSYLDSDEIQNVVSLLKESVTVLKESIGTGKEDIEYISNRANECLKRFEKSLRQEFTNDVLEASDDLSYYIECWNNVFSGNLVYSEADEADRVTITKKSLIKKLNEFEKLKDEFIKNNARIEKEINLYEADKAELDNKILKEDNERRLNQLYSKVKSLESKLNILTVRNESYTSCHQLLDLIYTHSKEIVESSGLIKISLFKRSLFLNINKLKSVMNDPSKALRILKVLQKDIDSINSNNDKILDKISKLDTNSSKISNDAMKYKEALLKKQFDKSNTQDLKDINVSLDKQDIKGEK